MIFYKKIIYFTVFCLTILYCYQPQLGSLPRWSKGIGIQGGYNLESYHKEKMEHQIHSSWLEQTYSFTREIGITVRESIYYETESKKTFGAFNLMMPLKYFFDSREVAQNFFLNPVFTYSTGAKSFFGGGVLGYFNETFKTYFVMATKATWQLGANQEYTRSFEGNFEWLVKGDFGYHFLYDEENNSGLWGLIRAQLHTKKNKRFHLTLQPSLMGYVDSINLIARIILPIWQGSEDNSSKNYGISIGIASAW